MASDPALKSTKGVTTYDGIFKNMYDEKIRDMFTDIRVNISKGEWKKAAEILKQTLLESERSPGDKKNSDDARTGSDALPRATDTSRNHQQD